MICREMCRSTIRFPALSLNKSDNLSTGVHTASIPALNSGMALSACMTQFSSFCAGFLICFNFNQHGYCRLCVHYTIFGFNESK